MKMQFKFVTALLATLVLAACANQMQPAQQALGQIDAAVQAVSADAAKYVPNQLEDVTKKLADLRAAFDKKDYKAVLAGAPAVLAEAKGLADAAAAKKTEYMNALTGDWTNLSAALPQAVAAIESRVGILSKSRKLPDGISKDTLAAAQTGLDQAKTAWGEATAAFGAGNVEEAVTKAKAIKARADEIMSSLGMPAAG
jgi:hypothetical protein